MMRDNMSVCLACLEKGLETSKETKSSCASRSNHTRRSTVAGGAATACTTALSRTTGTCRRAGGSSICSQWRRIGAVVIGLNVGFGKVFVETGDDGLDGESGLVRECVGENVTSGNLNRLQE